MGEEGGVKRKLIWLFSKGAIQEFKRKGKFVFLLGGLPEGVSVNFCFSLSLFNGVGHYFLGEKEEELK